MSDPGVYRCPVCNKPFDRTDKLFNFAVAAHEKDHEASRNSPAGLIRQTGGGTWLCKLCGHDLGRFEESAKLAMITHAREAHGSVPYSSAPVAIRGGRGQGTQPGSVSRSRTLGEIFEDGWDAAMELLGGMCKGD